MTNNERVTIHNLRKEHGRWVSDGERVIEGPVREMPSGIIMVGQTMVTPSLVISREVIR